MEGDFLTMSGSMWFLNSAAFYGWLFFVGEAENVLYFCEYYWDDYLLKKHVILNMC